MKNLRKEKSSSLKSSFEVDEKEILTDTDNSSSNWVTQSQMTVSDVSESTSGEKMTETKNELNQEEGSTADIKSLTDTYTVVSESDDNLVIVVSEQTNAKSHVTEECEQSLAEEKQEAEVKTERSRGNIPNSTGSKPYLRSHSGSWKTHRKRRQSKSDKISASLPAEQPFQANLSQTIIRESQKLKNCGNPKLVELPKLNDDQGHQGRASASSSPPLPPVSPSTSPQQFVGASSGSGRVSRSIENVISKLDRRSMSVLPQIGKSDSEGKL